MRFLVIGCGSIGERHIRNLLSISAGELIVSDIDSTKLDKIKKKYNVVGFRDYLDALEQQPDGVLVCSPPNSHVAISLDALKNNAHVFIEKPLSNTMNRVDDLLRYAMKRDLVVCVGYNFRFQKGIRMVKDVIVRGGIGRVLAARAEFGQYLPDWRPWQDYSKSYTAKSNLGGGIILDGSHEIDYMRWFLGDVQSVFCYADTLSKLDVETEDVAEILMKFTNNVISEIHLDFVRPGYSRNCEIIGEKGVIVWDFQAKTVDIYSSVAKKWERTEINDDINDMYVEEMKHFVKVVSGAEKPLINGAEGKLTLQIALSAKQSAKSHKVVKICDKSQQ